MATRKQPARARMVALLRGINVGGNKKVPMADLRALAEELGFAHVQTYIQSGNLVFSTELSQSEAEGALEAAIVRTFGFPVEVVARTQRAWNLYAAGSPFADAQRERPNLLHLALSKSPLKAGCVAALEGYAKAGERITALRDGLWIDFNASVGQSKLTPQVIDRAAGSTVTARNWRTVQVIAEMLSSADSRSGP